MKVVIGNRTHDAACLFERPHRCAPDPRPGDGLERLRALRPNAHDAEVAFETAWHGQVFAPDREGTLEVTRLFGIAAIAGEGSVPGSPKRATATQRQSSFSGAI